MSGPTCIVCGKPIRKRTKTVYFKQAGEGFPHGTRKQDGPYSMLVDLFVDKLPLTKAEAQRHLNEEVVSVSRGVSGGVNRIWNVTTWDGESYDDRYFHSEGCAAAFGRRMAGKGFR